jgi:hypothetical protein
MSDAWKWISVAERMPTDRGRVLVLVESIGYVTIADFRPDNKRKRWVFDVAGFNVNSRFGKPFYESVTHWMRLPSPRRP